MAIKTNTKAPSGISIKRNGNNFTVTWKIADKNYSDGQQFQYRIGGGSWVSVSCGVATKSKTFALPVASLYPNTKRNIQNVSVRIRGNRTAYTSGGKTYQPAWSAWSTKVYSLAVPNIPSLTATLSDQDSNVTTFTWSTTTSATDNRPYVNVEWQTILAKNSNVTDGKKLAWNSAQLGWQTGSNPMSYSKTVTEDNTLINDGNSYTRWFRVRARGARGASAWRYAKHVYAKSNQAVIEEAYAEETESNGFNVVVTWTAAGTASRPIDHTVIEYAIAVPQDGISTPVSPSWQVADTQRDTANTDTARFSIDDTLDKDECIFVRVNTQHDGKTTTGVPANAYVGSLKDPTNLSVTEGQNFMATISATNGSDAPDAFMAVTYMGSNDPDNAFVVGIIPPGETSVTVQCPDWSAETAKAFGVQTIIGEYTATVRADGITSYVVDKLMQSDNIVWEGGAVPNAPGNVAVTATNTPGNVRVTWNWNWQDADTAEISWSDDKDAWESTSQPQTYEINNLHAASWIIAGLETGVKWYVRVRLKSGSGENVTAGPWSEITAQSTIDLASAPSIPVLFLSAGTITPDGQVTASWGYSTTDGTAQAYAEICTATINSGGITYGDIIAHTETAQHITLDAEDLGWQAGETYNLCVRVTSASGKTSDAWSDPVPVIVAEPLTCEITSTSLETVTVPDDEDEGTTREITALTEMPLTVTVEGAGAGGTTILAIERAESYYMDRPDDSEFNGFEGETVYLFSQTGEDTITVNVADLIGPVDDGALYRLVATVQDGLGQSAQDTIDFEVAWSHQAITPEAQVEINYEDAIAIITPQAPTGVAEDDVVDIYRLSVDKPELIVEGGSFGTAYVDPYPTIGEYGGHRVVTRTANGDYITEDMQPAWLDLQEDAGDIYNSPDSIINFNGIQINVQYNAELSTSFEKEFEETKYLGGSVQGDWNLAVSRSSTIKAVAATQYDADAIENLRALAEYSGICHVRSKDGSSYAADVQISDDISYDSAGKILNFTMSITRVDPEGLDGMTLAEWLNS